MTAMTTAHRNAFTAAATAGGLAPSIHNTQPWHWRIDDDRLELWSGSPNAALAEGSVLSRLERGDCRWRSGRVACVASRQVPNKVPRGSSFARWRWPLSRSPFLP